ncbi:unnamed protein product [Leptidea sinapis]|uniref:Uncharacterized protein n=1 Tax=Leptidea sinapis TaxID=189913 RepID=A0A5E4Q4F8_9NEOP|nr:unnamed protein product [Leptidea sinapis]
MNFFRKAPTVKEQQRQNDRELRKATREIDRDKVALEREEKKLEMEIKKMAKEGNNEGCKVLAKQLVQFLAFKFRIKQWVLISQSLGQWAQQRKQWEA